MTYKPTPWGFGFMKPLYRGHFKKPIEALCNIPISVGKRPKCTHLQIHKPPCNPSFCGLCETPPCGGLSQSCLYGGFMKTPDISRKKMTKNVHMCVCICVWSPLCFGALQSSLESSMGDLQNTPNICGKKTKWCVWICVQSPMASSSLWRLFKFPSVWGLCESPSMGVHKAPSVSVG